MAHSRRSFLASLAALPFVGALLRREADEIAALRELDDLSADARREEERTPEPEPRADTLGQDEVVRFEPGVTYVVYSDRNGWYAPGTTRISSNAGSCFPVQGSGTTFTYHYRYYRA